MYYYLSEKGCSWSLMEVYTGTREGGTIGVSCCTVTFGCHSCCNRAMALQAIVCSVKHSALPTRAESNTLRIVSSRSVI
jgi:hypothetical protein